MFYRYSLLIEGGQTEDDPAEAVAVLPKGVLNRVEITFRDGCRGYAHVIINHLEHQLFPTNPEETFAADGWTIAFDENYDLPEEWNRLVMRGWSPNANFDHTIIFRFGVTGKRWGIKDLIGFLEARGW